MKLSQKLLGLAGLAVADYACCPYDDYGIVDPNCGLTEKTPFNVPNPAATDDWNNNMCKAWEANVDATFDGHDGGCAAENWGGCGFQRHFAWGKQVGIDSQFTSIELDTSVAFDGVFTTADLTRTIAAGVNEYTVGGKPFLGGICKLFVPVAQNKITQVTVAGVHVSGKAVYPANLKKGATGFPGTAFCFSVVNIQEFKTNTNGVGNGNVAGAQPQVLKDNAYDFNEDIFGQAGVTSLQRQLGRAIGGFGDTVEDAAASADQDQMVEDGANFDVVAHFDSTICRSVWTTVDMQLSPDSRSGVLDYELDPAAASFTHAHTDLQDKRHATAPIAAGGSYADLGTGYLTGNTRWPNFGAWAGYNSAVLCANVGATATDHWLHQNSPRKPVMSVGSADFRSHIDDGTLDCAADNWAEYQFNVRQIGTGVIVCGPGQLPDTDSKRCTWNWNYNSGASFGAGSTSDAEGFFDRSENMDFAVWSRKRRGAVGRNDAAPGQPVNAAAVLTMPEFTFSFKSYKNGAITPVLTQLSHDVGAVDGTGVPTTTGIRVNNQKITVECVNSFDGTNNQRDLFPSCFVGDEIHLKASYKPDIATEENRAFISPWLSTVTATAASFP